MPEKEVAEAIIHLYRRGFITLSEGNVSIRDGERFFITPGGLRKDRVRPEDIAVVGLDGKIIKGKPSSEYRLHLAIYRIRNDINAIVHTHPPFAVALAVSGISLEYPLLAEAVTFLGPVPIVPFELPSTDALAERAGEFIKKYDNLLLENHGAVTTAENLDLGLALMETLEHTAEVLWKALFIGRIKIFDRSEVEKLLSLRKTYGLSHRPWRAEDFRYNL